MRAMLLPLALSLSLAGVGQVQAHDCRAYWVEVVCNDEGVDCRAHMAHTPGNGLESDPVHSYWYVSATKRSTFEHKLPVWQNEDTELCRTAELVQHRHPLDGRGEGNHGGGNGAGGSSQ